MTDAPRAQSAHLSFPLEREVDAGGLWAITGVALAGIYATAPATLLPALVDEWVEHLHIRDDVAGYIGAGGLISQIPGLLLGIRLIARLSLPKIAVLGFLIAAAADVVSLATADTGLMVTARVVNGFGSGLLLAASVNWLGRHPQAERAFGVLTLLQFVVPAITLACLPSLVATVGHVSIYLCALTVAVIALTFVPLFRLNGGDRPLATSRSQADRVHRLAFLLMAVVAFAAFNIAQMGIWAFIVRYGEINGIGTAVVTQTVALSSACGVPGSLLVVALGTRLGRARTAAAGCIACIVPMLAFALWSPNPTRFTLEVCLLSTAWAFTAPYIQGTQAALDATGKLAVWGMVAASAGASAGPALIGAIGQRYSFQVGFAVSAVGMMLCAALLLPAARAAGQGNRSKIHG
jgi:predicted MFS family arabinose efflux permease